MKNYLESLSTTLVMVPQAILFVLPVTICRWLWITLTPIWITNDIPIQAKSYSFYKVAMGLNLYYSPMLIVAGFLGNSLSLLVMLQRNNRKFSCCVYLAGLALGDNLFMCNALHLWLMTAIFPAQFTFLHCTIVAYSFQVREFYLLTPSMRQ